MADPVRGRTRWGVFAAVMAPCAVAVAALAAAVLNGVLAASLAVAGVPLQLNVNSLEGTGLTLYPTEIQPLVGDSLPIAAAGIGSAKIEGLCLALGADVPLLGAVSVKAVSDDVVEGSNLVLSAASLGGDLRATDAIVGQDASAFTIGNPAAKGPQGVTGLQAASVTLENVSNTSYGLIAGSLSIKGVAIEAVAGTTTPC
ncbi:MAG: DUF6230 family protein [Pseudonocardia sp.]|nr:DUF6230 family protein [Pseudonocardia sp.]